MFSSDWYLPMFNSVLMMQSGIVIVLKAQEL